MVDNCFKNNIQKIDVALYGSKQQLAKINFNHIDLLDSRISFSKNVKDLGVVFVCNMSMSSEITKMFQSANHHLRNVKIVARYPPEDTV